jgi:hypothetical protein
MCGSSERNGVPGCEIIYFFCYVISFLSGKIRKAKLSVCLTNYALCNEGVWGSGCINPRFLDLSTIWWVVSFKPRPLKEPRYQLNRRLGGPQRRSGWYGEVKILGPIGTRTPTSPVVQPAVNRYTALFRTICANRRNVSRLVNGAGLCRSHANC